MAAVNLPGRSFPSTSSSSVLSPFPDDFLTLTIKFKINFKEELLPNSFHEWNSPLDTAQSTLQTFHCKLKNWNLFIAQNFD